MDIYDRITKLLKSKNMTRRQLALKTGIPITTLNSAFIRKTQGLPLKTTSKIAEVLNVDLNYLLSGQQNRLTEVRVSKGLSVEQLAEATGYSFKEIMQLENEETDLPVLTMRKLGEALNVSEFELLPTYRRVPYEKAVKRMREAMEKTIAIERKAADGLPDYPIDGGIDDIIDYIIDGGGFLGDFAYLAKLTRIKGETRDIANDLIDMLYRRQTQSETEGDTNAHKESE